MRRLLAPLVLSSLLVACGDDSNATPDTAGPDTTSDTSDAAPEDAVADTTAPDAADSAAPDAADTNTPPADTTAPDAIEDVAGDTTPAPTTWAEVQPIFNASCSLCHGGNSPTSGSGGHAIGSPDAAVAYQAAKQAAKIGKCAGKTVGECALIRIRDGSMPATGDCADDPPGTLCPDEAEQALIEKWITDGMSE